MFKLSQFEKIFWATILLFFTLYITIYIIAYQKSESIMGKQEDKNKTIMKDLLKDKYQDVIKYTTVIKEIEDLSMKKALENNTTLAAIEYNLQNNKEELEKKIDAHLNHAFGVIYGNIDNFLDFHYSIVGEYTQLGAMATGKIEQSVQEKLFPPSFTLRIKRLDPLIAKEFQRHTQKHLNFVKSSLTKDVNMELNSDAFKRLNADIEHHVETQKLKISAIVTISIASMVAKVVASKIALKASSKVAIKSSAKLATKGASTGAAAATGALCGPAVVICSPVLATIAWFGSDALLLEADEYLHRDEFKKEIIASIDDQKEILKRDYKRIYGKSLEKLSQTIKAEYQKQEIKKKVRVKIIDKINLVK